MQCPACQHETNDKTAGDVTVDDSRPGGDVLSVTS